MMSRASLRLKPGLGVGDALARQKEIAASASASQTRPVQARKLDILGVGEKRIALMVDHLLGQESTVVQPLGNYLHRCSGLVGATISGDGRVRLVLDPAGLLAASQNRAPEIRKALA